MAARRQLLVIFVGVIVVLGSIAALEYYRAAIPAVTTPYSNVTTKESNPPSFPPGVRLYDVTFQQRGACSPVFWMLPWAVTLNSWTQIQPHGATIPPQYYYGTSDASLAEIVFSVPNGSYQWKAFPTTGYNSDPTSGVVKVSGSNVTVQVDGEPTGCTTTNSNVATSNSTTLSQSSQAIQAALAECSNVLHASTSGSISVGTNSPAIICLQLFYYNPSATLTLNLTAFLSIYAVQYGPGTVRSFSGDSNFTIMASQDQLVLSGPMNENEGAVVGFAITAKQGASGTYQLNLLS